MKLSFAPAVFLIAFCFAYIGVFAMDLPLLRYYPLHGDFSWGWRKLKDAGPAMAWYGLLANAAIAASLLAIVIPDSVIGKPVRRYLWLFPVVAMLACGVLLRHFFA